MIKKEIFVEYRNIGAQIKELTERKRIISEKLIKEMKREDVERVNSDFGVFSMFQRKTFKFAEEVNTEIKGYKDKIKKVEETAIIDGKATETLIETVRFLPKKKKENN